MQPKYVKIRRNPNYLASVRAALVQGVYWAPTSFVATVKLPVSGIILGFATLISALFGLTVTVCFWVFARLFMIAAGLLGFVTEAQPVSESINQG